MPPTNDHVVIPDDLYEDLFFFVRASGREPLLNRLRQAARGPSGRTERMTMRKTGSFSVLHTSPTACVKEGTTVYHFDIEFTAEDPVLNTDGFLAIDNIEIDEWIAAVYSDPLNCEEPAESCEKMARSICKGLTAYIEKKGTPVLSMTVRLTGSPGASLTVTHSR